jgi:hypothetical protein
VSICVHTPAQQCFRCVDSKTKSELIGDARCKLTDIVLNATRTVTFTLALPPDHKGKHHNSRGTITIVGDDENGPNTMMTMMFSAQHLEKKDLFGKSDPFLVLSRVRDNGTTSQVAKTEVIKSNLNPTWKPLKATTRGLCGTNVDAVVLCEVSVARCTPRSDERSRVGV